MNGIKLKDNDNVGQGDRSEAAVKSIWEVLNVIMKRVRPDTQDTWMKGNVQLMLYFYLYLRIRFAYLAILWHCLIFIILRGIVNSLIPLFNIMLLLRYLQTSFLFILLNLSQLTFTRIFFFAFTSHSPFFHRVSYFLICCLPFLQPITLCIWCWPVFTWAMRWENLNYFWPIAPFELIFQR